MAVHEVREIEVSRLGESLSRLRLCSPKALEQIERSLRRLGQLSAVLVSREGDGLEVVDGFKRVRAARALSWKTVRTEEVVLDAAEAKLRMVRSNEETGLSEMEEAWLLRSLYREDGLSQPAIAVLFGRHKSWVNRRLLLAEGLCDEVQPDLRLGLLSVTVAKEVARLPRGNQREVAAVAVRRGLTTRQTAKLVERWLSSPDEEGRARELERAGAEELRRRVLHGSGGNYPDTGGGRGHRTQPGPTAADTRAPVKSSRCLGSQDDIAPRSRPRARTFAAGSPSPAPHGLRGELDQLAESST